MTYVAKFKLKFIQAFFRKGGEATQKTIRQNCNQERKAYKHNTLFTTHTELNQIEEILHQRGQSFFVVRFCLLYFFFFNEIMPQIYLYHKNSPPSSPHVHLHFLIQFCLSTGVRCKHYSCLSSPPQQHNTQQLKPYGQ